MEYVVKEKAKQIIDKELVRAKQLRQRQARQQAIAWSDENRRRFAEERERQIKSLSDVLTAKLHMSAIQQIEEITEMHDLELAEVGAAHRAAALLTNYSNTKEVKRLGELSVAQQRGAAALRVQRETRYQKAITLADAQKRRDQVRVMEDYKAKDLVTKKPFGTVNTLKMNVKQDAKRGPPEFQQSLAGILRVYPEGQENVSRSTISKKSSKRRSVSFKSPFKSPKKTGDVSKHRSQLSPKSPKATSVIYFDASIPNSKARYVAPSGISHRHTGQSPTGSNAWDAAKELSTGKPEGMSLSKEEMDKRADARGKQALRRERFDRIYKAHSQKVRESTGMPDVLGKRSVIDIVDAGGYDEKKEEIKVSSPVRITRTDTVRDKTQTSEFLRESDNMLKELERLEKSLGHGSPKITWGGVEFSKTPTATPSSSGVSSATLKEFTVDGPLPPSPQNKVSQITKQMLNKAIIDSERKQTAETKLPSPDNVHLEKISEKRDEARHDSEKVQRKSPSYRHNVTSSSNDTSSPSTEAEFQFLVYPTGTKAHERETIPTAPAQRKIARKDTGIELARYQVNVNEIHTESDTTGLSDDFGAPGRASGSGKRYRNQKQVSGTSADVETSPEEVSLKMKKQMKRKSQKLGVVDRADDSSVANSTTEYYSPPDPPGPSAGVTLYTSTPTQAKVPLTERGTQIMKHYVRMLLRRRPESIENLKVSPVDSSTDLDVRSSASSTTLTPSDESNATSGNTNSSRYFSDNLPSVGEEEEYEQQDSSRTNVTDSSGSTVAEISARCALNGEDSPRCAALLRCLNGESDPQRRSAILRCLNVDEEPVSLRSQDVSSSIDVSLSASESQRNPQPLLSLPTMMQSRLNQSVRRQSHSSGSGTSSGTSSDKAQLSNEEARRNLDSFREQVEMDSFWTSPSSPYLLTNPEEIVSNVMGRLRDEWAAFSLERPPW